MRTADFVEFVRDTYKTNDFIPLHAPSFEGNEKAYLLKTIESTFVSSVGEFVDEFERKFEAYTETAQAVATVNGTAALHSALYLAGVESEDLVITQALTFVATCNALHHMGAKPIFVDVSPDSLGLSPKAVEEFLSEHAALTDEGCIHKESKKRIKAVVAVHTFGHPAELDELVKTCLKWKLKLVEDAAESLGSFYKGKHTGTFGEFGVVSFNGNKIITTGGGGTLLCRTRALGKRAKHMTTTAKVPHPYEFYHDEAGFNYRMPNLNAALGCAQIENLSSFVHKKRKLADLYEKFFKRTEFEFVKEPDYATSNYWLNAIICPSVESRENLLRQTNESGIMTRPAWTLMNELPMFKNALRDDLDVSKKMGRLLINIPSSVVT